MKSLFLVENLNVVVILIKYIQKTGTVHISSPEIHSAKALKIYHINDLFNLFPYYDSGENYRENGQNDSLQSTTY